MSFDGFVSKRIIGGIIMETKQEIQEQGQQNAASGVVA